MKKNAPKLKNLLPKIKIKKFPHTILSQIEKSAPNFKDLPPK